MTTKDRLHSNPNAARMLARFLKEFADMVNPRNVVNGVIIGMTLLAVAMVAFV